MKFFFLIMFTAPVVGTIRYSGLGDLPESSSGEKWVYFRILWRGKCLTENKIFSDKCPQYILLHNFLYKSISSDCNQQKGRVNVYAITVHHCHVLNHVLLFTGHLFETIGIHKAVWYFSVSTKVTICAMLCWIICGLHRNTRLCDIYV